MAELTPTRGEPLQVYQVHVEILQVNLILHLNFVFLSVLCSFLVPELCCLLDSGLAPALTAAIHCNPLTRIGHNPGDPGFIPLATDCPRAYGGSDSPWASKP